MQFRFIYFNQLMKTTLILALILGLSIFAYAQDVEEDFVQDTYEDLAFEETQYKEPIKQQATFQEQPVQQRPRVVVPAGPFFTMQKLHFYRYELVAIAFVLIYIICYLRGKISNAQLIESFYKQVQPYIQQNFAHIGFTKEHNEEPFIGESANQVLFYASGRSNIQYMEMNFSMRKRQDLIYQLVYEMIWPEKDLITIDIPVKSEVPLVFLMSMKKRLRGYIEKNLDVQMLTGAFQVKGLNNNYEVLGESAQTVDQLMDGYITKKVSDNNGLFMFIHYTDQKMFSESTGHLRVILNGAYKDKQKYSMAMQVIFHLVDKIVSLKMPQNIKAKALQSRQVFNASKQKAKLQAHKEQLQKQKQQKKRKQQAWLRSLPADKQKREDEKRKKKQMNKMMKGRTMKVM